MAYDKVRKERWVFIRLWLMALVLLPWFFSCPPPPPQSTPPPESPSEEQASVSTEPQAQAEETAPAPADEETVSAPEPSVPSDYVSMTSLVVPGNESWVNLGFDVELGQRIFFAAAGVLSLQKGNPTAVCGPDGYKLKTVQQPLPDQYIGALVGKVVKLLSEEKDEETGKTIRHEQVDYFFVGSRGEVAMPGTGRLYLGINEQVVGDNEGAFQVTLYVLR